MTDTDTPTSDVELRFDPWPHSQEPIFDAYSHEAIRYLAPIVGPTAVLVLHHVAGKLTDHPMTYYTSSAALSHAVGGGPTGALQLLYRALGRLVRFEMALQVAPGSYQVRLTVPPLSQRLIARLPLVLQLGLPAH
ncbi:MAG: hypothetical protein ACK5LS_02640 [Propioniciclava sp.]